MIIFSKLVTSVCKLKPSSLKSKNSIWTSGILKVKVAVYGSSSGVGQPLSLLLKMSPYIDELTLYDVADCPGLATDLSHINTKTKVKHFEKATSLGDTFKGKEIIVVAGGKTREPGMKRVDLFKDNVKYVVEVTENMIKSAPQAMLCILMNPINSLLPVAAGILSKAKVYNPKRLFGITTLDCIRASTFAAELMCFDPIELTVPVVGGHSCTTIVPVFSQSSIPIDIPKDKMLALVERVQKAGDETLEAKGSGTATLSAAYAGARFIFALSRALNGEKNVIECAMVQSEITDATFFANPLILGHKGVYKNLGYGKLNKEECCLLTKAVKDLIDDIEVGTMFLAGPDSKAKKGKQPELDDVKKKNLPKGSDKVKEKKLTK